MMIEEANQDSEESQNEESPDLSVVGGPGPKSLGQTRASVVSKHEMVVEKVVPVQNDVRIRPVTAKHEGMVMMLKRPI